MAVGGGAAVPVLTLVLAVVFVSIEAAAAAVVVARGSWETGACADGGGFVVALGAVVVVSVSCCGMTLFLTEQWILKRDL